jgi:hypothetical protein
MSQKFWKFQVDELHIIAQTLAALVVAEAVGVAIVFFLFQKVKGQKAYHYRGFYPRVGYFAAHLKFQRVSLSQIEWATFPEVMLVDHLNFNIDSAHIHEFRGNIEDGEFRFRVRPVKFAGDNFKVSDPVVALKKERRVDESYQEWLAPLSGKKIPHESVVESVDLPVGHINNPKRNIVERSFGFHDIQYLLLPMWTHYTRILREEGEGKANRRYHLQ